MPKVPRCLPSPAWLRARKLTCARVHPNCVPREPLPQAPRRFTKIATACKSDPLRPFARGLPRRLPRALLANSPDVFKSCLQSRPLAKPFRFYTVSLLLREALPSRSPKHPLTLPRPFLAPLLCPKSFQVVYRKPSSITEHPPPFPKQIPSPAGRRLLVKLVTEAPPPQCVYPPTLQSRVKGRCGEETTNLCLWSLFKFRSLKPAEQLTKATSLSDLGATSPGNLMMGDGGAVARPNRQPRTQSTRRGPASAPQAPSASVIALPGPARRPGGRWLCACGPVAAWLALAPPRSRALRGTAGLGGLGFARLSGSCSEPRAPARAAAARARCSWSPFVSFKPQMPSLPAAPEEVWMQRKQGRAAARCGRLGWEGAGSVGSRGWGGGGGGAVHSGPPLSAPRAPLLFSFLRLFSPPPAAPGLSVHRWCATSLPLPPTPGTKPKDPRGETSGATTGDS